MADEGLGAIREAADHEPRDSETVAEYLRRVGRDVEAPDRAEAALDAYNAARFGPTGDLDEEQRAALEAFLGAVRGAGQAADPGQDTGPAARAPPGEEPADGQSADEEAADPPAGAARDARQPGRGLEPPVAVPDVAPLEAGPRWLAGETAPVGVLRRGELLALLAVVLFVAAGGVAAATAGPGPATDGPLAVSAQGGFAGATGYVMATGADWRSDRLAGAFEADWVGEDRVLATVIERGRPNCGEIAPPVPGRVSVSTTSLQTPWFGSGPARWPTTRRRRCWPRRWVPTERS